MVLETICMNCQILFSGENKKNIIKVSSAEFAQRVVKVLETICMKFQILFSGENEQNSINVESGKGKVN